MSPLPSNRSIDYAGQQHYLDKAVDLYWDCCSRYQKADDPYRALSWADMTIGTYVPKSTRVDGCRCARRGGSSGPIPSDNPMQSKNTHTQA